MASIEIRIVDQRDPRTGLNMHVPSILVDDVAPTSEPWLDARFGDVGAAIDFLEDQLDVPTNLVDTTFVWRGTRYDGPLALNRVISKMRQDFAPGAGV